MKNMKRAFTLVELMVAVSILAIGIILVLRSFLSASDALDISRAKIEATKFLENKMSELEESAKLDSGVETSEVQEQAVFLNRDATYIASITPAGETGESEAESKTYNQVSLSLSWKQSNKERDAQINTYMPNKKK